MFPIVPITFHVLLLMSVKFRPAKHVPTTSFRLYRAGQTPKPVCLPHTVPYLNAIPKIISTLDVEIILGITLRYGTV